MASGPPSTLRAALQLLARSVRGRSPPDAPPGIPRRKLAVERGAIEVQPQQVTRFLRATEGMAISALQGPRAPLPPTFPALWETALALELLALEGAPLPRYGLIHLESEMVSIRPLRAGDPIRSRLELERVEPHRRGTVLTLKGRHWSAAGQLCQENRFALLVRSRREDGSAGASRREEPGDGGAGEGVEWREVAAWTLRANHGRRYARASGDYNPIHLWRWSSRLMGFDGPILQGYCTEALVAHALLERFTGGDPTLLRRLRIAFRSPLPLPARVRLLCAPAAGGGGGRFRVVDAVEPPGSRPYAEGEWVGAEC